MKRLIALSLFLTFPVLAWIGCGGGGPGSFSTNPQAAAVYVTGEDAPLSSVVSLNLTINSITLTGQTSSSQLVASPITVDFARLVGLRTPLAFKAVPPDTYSSATFVLASPVIDYISTVSSAAGDHAKRYFQQPHQHRSPDHVGDSELSHAHGGGRERLGRFAHGV